MGQENYPAEIFSVEVIELFVEIFKCALRGKLVYSSSFCVYWRKIWRHKCHKFILSSPNIVTNWRYKIVSANDQAACPPQPTSFQWSFTHFLSETWLYNYYEDELKHWLKSRYLSVLWKTVSKYEWLFSWIKWFLRVKFNRWMALKILVFIMTFSFIIEVFLASTIINLNKFQNNFMSPTMNAAGKSLPAPF